MSGEEREEGDVNVGTQFVRIYESGLHGSQNICAS